jgi:hypothetical protein
MDMMDGRVNRFRASDFAGGSRRERDAGTEGGLFSRAWGRSALLRSTAQLLKPRVSPKLFESQITTNIWISNWNQYIESDSHFIIIFLFNFSWFPETKQGLSDYSPRWFVFLTYGGENLLPLFTLDFPIQSRVEVTSLSSLFWHWEFPLGEGCLWTSESYPTLLDVR